MSETSKRFFFFFGQIFVVQVRFNQSLRKERERQRPKNWIQIFQIYRMLETTIMFSVALNCGSTSRQGGKYKSIHKKRKRGGIFCGLKNIYLQSLRED